MHYKMRWTTVFCMLPAIILTTGCPGGVGTGGSNGQGGVDNNAEDEGFCDDGSLSVIADLLSTNGAQTGTLEYREVNGCKEFIARVENFAAGNYDVHVSDVNVGQLTVDDSGTGQLEYDSQSGTFPASFPTPTGGDSGDVGRVVLGTFTGDCPAIPKVCPSGAGGNGNGGGGNGGSNSGTVQLTVTPRS